MPGHLFRATADDATVRAERMKLAALRGYGFLDVGHFLVEYDAANVARGVGNYAPGQSVIHQEMMEWCSELYTAGKRDAAAAMLEPDLRDEAHIAKLNAALYEAKILVKPEPEPKPDQVAPPPTKRSLWERMFNG